MWLYLIIIFLPIIHYFTTVNKKTNSKVFLFVYICFLTIFVGANVECDTIVYNDKQKEVARLIKLFYKKMIVKY